MLNSEKVPPAGPAEPVGSIGTVDALTAALIEIERHVGAFGWDQPSRLFALAPTADLIAAEPSLANQLSLLLPDSLSSIEQDDFHGGNDIVDALARIRWPEQVTGVALATERSFLRAEDEVDLPTEPDAAAQVVANHPGRVDIRVVIGVLRDGTPAGVARLASEPEELLVGPDLVPALTRALLNTLS